MSVKHHQIKIYYNRDVYQSFDFKISFLEL